MNQGNATVETAAAGPSHLKRNAALIGGGLGLVAVGALAAALVLKPPHQAEPVADATVATSAEPAKVAKKAQGNHANAEADQRSGTTPLDTQHAMASCATCGVVEAVTPVQKKGEGTGLGAVAGGVLGGVVGHQVGGGNGKTAMTVLGAVGGGLAGNEIEKRQRATTVYQLKIRMADGSTRSITQAHELPVGQQVHVDGQKITPVTGEGAAPGGARVVDTAARSS